MFLSSQAPHGVGKETAHGPFPCAVEQRWMWGIVSRTGIPQPLDKETGSAGVPRGDAFAPLF